MEAPQETDTQDEACRKLRALVERAALEKAFACTGLTAGDRNAAEACLAWLQVAEQVRH